MFAWLRPGDLIWNYWVNNYLLGKKPPAFDILFWNSDTTRMTAGLHADFVDLAIDNTLTKPGAVTVLGVPIDLARSPWTPTSWPVSPTTSPRGRTATAPPSSSAVRRGSCSRTSGHIAALVNPPGNPKATYHTNDDDTADAKVWLKGAETHQGTWWTDVVRMAGRALRRAQARAHGARHRPPAGRWPTPPASTSWTSEETTMFENIARARGTDFFRIADQLTAEERDYWNRARRFVDDEVLPVINDYWERAEFPHELVRRLGELGLVGRRDRGLRLPADEPDRHRPGAPGAQPRGRQPRHLPRRAGRARDAVDRDARLRGAEAALAAEDGGGRDARRLRADRAGPRLRLRRPRDRRPGATATRGCSTAGRSGSATAPSPTSSWSGPGTSPTARSRASSSSAARPGTTPAGSTARARSAPCGRRRSPSTDVEVPETDRLPGATSFKDTARVLAGTRNAVAWGALGHATAAYEIAVAYCSERTQFGKPLVSFQIVQDKLVKMLAEVCSMQLYCLRLGRLIEEGSLTDTIAAIAKMNNTRKAREVVAEARDLLGGNGILLDFHVMRHMADMEALHTYEGTETIQTLIVGRDITGVGAFA